MSHAQELPVVSVVVIGRNEGARLIRCPESVRAMRAPGGQVELIYIDSASTDGSPERAAACGAKVLIVRPERPCAAVGRNAGWQAAAAPFVLFLDGDTLLHPDFVADCLPQFTLPHVAVVWGHRRELHPEASMYNRLLDLDWVYPPGPSEFCGGDALIRHSVLQEVGGYDERLIAGEEPEMCRRMRAKGYVILHVDRPMTEHDLAMTRWSQYWRRAVRAGYAYAEVAQRFRGTHTPLWQHEVQRNRVHGAVLVGCPVFALVSSLALASALPLVVLLGVSAGIIVRTAAKARWKSADRWRGRHRGLIEYNVPKDTIVVGVPAKPLPERRIE